MNSILFLRLCVGHQLDRRSPLLDVVSPTELQERLYCKYVFLKQMIICEYYNTILDRRFS